MIGKIYNFITVEIWRIDSDSLGGFKAFVLRLVRVVALALRGFQEDKCFIKASGLTFYTLLSIVPLIAMAFAIAKGFGYEKTLQENILNSSENYKEIWEQVFVFATSMLDNTKGGLVGGIGVVILLYTVIRVMIQIEESLNDIWHVKKARSWTRKFSDYFSIMFLSPILIIVSGGVTVFIQTQLISVLESISFLGYFSNVIGFLINSLPYLLVWLAFSLLYMIMPNTKVHWQAAVVAGIIAGSVFLLVDWLYIYFQVGVAKYNAIYGSFAALPLFLVWLQTSWAIVLLGAEISFAYQNAKNYVYEYDFNHISPSYRKKLAVILVTEIVNYFNKHQKPMSVVVLANDLKLPARISLSIINELVEAELIVQIHDDDHKEDVLLMPAKPVDTYNLAYVLHELDELGQANIPIQNQELMNHLNKTFDDLYHVMEVSDCNYALANKETIINKNTHSPIND